MKVALQKKMHLTRKKRKVVPYKKIVLQKKTYLIRKKRKVML